MMRTEKLAVSALEQPSARSARPALGGPAVLALQRSAGNQAVTRMLAGTKRVLARTETTFNPWSAVHDLRRAVDQSQASDGWGFDDSGTLRASTRKVDAARVIRVLEALTPPQIALVRSLYQAQERTTLENDLFGSGQSEHASNLKPDQRARIEALLKGGSDTRLEATAIELHQLLSGELEEAERERVMALLRRPADEIEAIEATTCGSITATRTTTSRSSSRARSSSARRRCGPETSHRPTRTRSRTIGARSPSWRPSVTRAISASPRRSPTNTSAGS